MSGRLLANLEIANAAYASAGRIWRDETQRRYSTEFHGPVHAIVSRYDRARSELRDAIEDAESVARDH